MAIRFNDMKVHVTAFMNLIKDMGVCYESCK